MGEGRSPGSPTRASASAASSCTSRARPSSLPSDALRDQLLELGPPVWSKPPTAPPDQSQPTGEPRPLSMPPGSALWTDPVQVDDSARGADRGRELAGGRSRYAGAWSRRGARRGSRARATRSRSWSAARRRPYYDEASGRARPASATTPASLSTNRPSRSSTERAQLAPHRDTPRSGRVQAGAATSTPGWTCSRTGCCAASTRARVRSGGVHPRGLAIERAAATVQRECWPRGSGGACCSASGAAGGGAPVQLRARGAAVLVQKREPMRGDLHHLFACESGCNSFRGNIPYFDFPDFEEAVREECGKRVANKFEPAGGKGAVARATLYFLLRYPEIDASTAEYEESGWRCCSAGTGETPPALRAAPQRGHLRAPGQPQPTHRPPGMGAADPVRAAIGA